MNDEVTRKRDDWRTRFALRLAPWLGEEIDTLRESLSWARAALEAKRDY
jgi:hypothetical protein